MHRLAFSTIRIQKALADLEDRLHARSIAATAIRRPVFITGLPRAGTTLLLEILGASRVFATHTYRNMPFVLTPLLWHAVTRRFHAPDAAFDRAHGDGMTIGYDSPEAFEEIVWRAFWPHKHRADRITPWAAAERDPGGEFEPFLRNHFAKLIALRAARSPAPDQVRYLSKNNANLCRIPTLVRLFPDAAVLAPFRNPFDHAASMLRQHLRFLRLHAAEPFTRRYMEDVGHCEFGANLRPIDFGRWLTPPIAPLARTADFWLRYWLAAYRHVLNDGVDNVVFVSFDALCANPQAAMRRVAAAIRLGDAPGPGAAVRFRAPTRYPAAALRLEDRSLLETSRMLHQQLLARCVAARGRA